MSKRAFTGNQVNELADYLRGSCGTIDGALMSLFGLQWDELTAEDVAAIEAKIFYCVRCFWWRDTADEKAPGVCDECIDEGDST